MPPLHTSPTSPTPLPDYHISDFDTTNPTLYHSNTTIQWVRDTFAPVFKALERLEVAIAKLSENLQAATSNLCSADLPIPPTSNPQPHRIQLQFLCPSSSHKQHLRETLSGNAPNLHNRTQPQNLQQTLDTQQTHHCHRNHTNHQEFPCPPLPIFQPHLSKGLPSSPSTYSTPHLPPIPSQQLPATLIFALTSHNVSLLCL